MGVSPERVLSKMGGTEVRSIMSTHRELRREGPRRENRRKRGKKAHLNLGFIVGHSLTVHVKLITTLCLNTWLKKGWKGKEEINTCQERLKDLRWIRDQRGKDKHSEELTLHEIEESWG